MQRWNRALAVLACLLFFNACGAQEAETTAETGTTMPGITTSAAAETLATVASPAVTEMTEETTTAEAAATTARAVETTVQTTAATTAEATAAVAAPSVREGEYPEGETVIETIDGLTYVNGILIANKTYLLPADYAPGRILPEAQTAFDTMRAAAKEEGLTLKIVSGYRSYQKQDKVYHNYAARDGAALADRYSARAGSSEHQTGYAMDINSVRQSFAETKEGKWLAAHCAEYGFILRYPKDKEAETGFMYEPWHIRYLGVELAQKITESGLCLEEYLGITSAYAEDQ